MRIHIHTCISACKEPRYLFSVNSISLKYALIEGYENIYETSCYLICSIVKIISDYCTIKMRCFINMYEADTWPFTREALIYILFFANICLAINRKDPWEKNSKNHFLTFVLYNRSESRHFRLLNYSSHNNISKVFNA